MSRETMTAFESAIIFEELLGQDLTRFQVALKGDNKSLPIGTKVVKHPERADLYGVQGIRERFHLKAIGSVEREERPPTQYQWTVWFHAGDVKCIHAEIKLEDKES
jgi:hypothetical protein